MKTKMLILLVFVYHLFGCTNDDSKVFETMSGKEAGITFINALEETEQLSILDYLYFYNGGGVAIGDINGDDIPDIFFSGNQVKNQLYLNTGNLKFKNISEEAGITGNSTWNTGAVMADINGDGLLDIYVCAVVGINGFDGYNELYINNGNATFTEQAEAYGLDFESFSSSAAFLDYDQDGDLDLYLLNHAVHTQESYGRADLRLERNFQTGDRLMRNDGSTFTDVSEEAGIYGGPNGYGLGIAVSDFNKDGWPDIYVGNDFHEDDYYYLNNGDGSFTESLKDNFGHTSRFSMGNDVADINHDGWPDIISLDMLPEDEKVLKSSQGDGNLQTQRLLTESYGYHYQFTRNMLYVNLPGAGYMETALLSNIAATDWSWSSLFGDFDQDGEQDIFVSNGIPKRPNNLDFINFVSDNQIQKKMNNTRLVDKKALKLMPTGKTHNYVFQGNGDLNFEDRSGDWMVKDTMVSGATAYGDLDNDGDLDVVTNNLNSSPSIYINKIDKSANYLKIRFKFNRGNQYGLGTKVHSYHNGKLQYKELYTVRGFQASSEPMIHFGYGQSKTIDSIKVIWPDGTYQVQKNVAANQTLTILPDPNRAVNGNFVNSETTPIFTKVENNLGIDFVHQEDNYTDYNRQKLIPYQFSDKGPALATGDLDNNGSTDIFFGGSKFMPSRIFVQMDSSFVEKKIATVAKDSVKEDIAALIADFDQNGANDLFVGTGGADFFDQMEPLLDSYYRTTDTILAAAPLPKYFENASTVTSIDFDSDGDLDLFIGTSVITNDFGAHPTSYLLENDKGNFRHIENEQFEALGMVSDAICTDFNDDGYQDLVVVGEWMAPKFFQNTNGKLAEVSVLENKINGLWQCIYPFDIDDDGDLDYMLGNWGLNSKFTATHEYPMKMWYSDFDENGSSETIVATAKDGKYYPLENFDVLASQLVSLKKKFNTYGDFAGKSTTEIIDGPQLTQATELMVNELRSGFLRNENGKFSFVPFQTELQIAPLKAFLSYDFDGDGKQELLTAGNYFGLKPSQGRLDSFPGALIENEEQTSLGNFLGLDLLQKSVRHLNVIDLNDESFLLVTVHDGKAQVYKINKGL